MSKLTNVKSWLIILAFVHTLIGVIINYQQNGNLENLSSFMVLGSVSIYLLFAAFMVTGNSQARLTIVLCAPFLILFLISIIMNLHMFGAPVATMPEGILPLFLWTMPILCSFKQLRDNK